MEELRDKNGLTEEEYLELYKPSNYENPAVTADAVVIVVENDIPSEILMIRRGNHPYMNCRALPGGFVNGNETTQDAALRELEEETGIKIKNTNAAGIENSGNDDNAEFIGVFSKPGRDPRMRVISCAYMIPVKEELKVLAADDAKDASWFSISAKMEMTSSDPDKNILKKMYVTLTKKDSQTPEILKISFDISEKNLVCGHFMRAKNVTSDGIAFDHAEIIASALLKFEKFITYSKNSGKRIAVAENATIVGNVELSQGVSIWYGVVLRGDANKITIGENSNVQDNAVIHILPDCETIIGKNVTIGHAAIIHGCTIEDDCLIGMNATVLNRTIIGKGSIVGAGAVVTEDKIIPPGSLVLGIPGRVVRQLTKEEIEGNRKNALDYVELSKSLPDYQKKN